MEGDDKMSSASSGHRLVMEDELEDLSGSDEGDGEEPAKSGYVQEQVQNVSVEELELQVEAYPASYECHKSLVTALMLVFFLSKQNMP